MDFLSSNSGFAVQNDRTYLPRITRETCSSTHNTHTRSNNKMHVSPIVLMLLIASNHNLLLDQHKYSCFYWCTTSNLFCTSQRYLVWCEYLILSPWRYLEYDLEKKFLNLSFNFSCFLQIRNSKSYRQHDLWQLYTFKNAQKQNYKNIRGLGRFP